MSDGSLTKLDVRVRLWGSGYVCMDDACKRKLKRNCGYMIDFLR